MPPERSVDDSEVLVLKFLADFHSVSAKDVEAHFARLGQDPATVLGLLESLVAKGFLEPYDTDGVVEYWPTRMCGEAMISIIHW